MTRKYNIKNLPDYYKRLKKLIENTPKGVFQRIDFNENAEGGDNFNLKTLSYRELKKNFMENPNSLYAYVKKGKITNIFTNFSMMGEEAVKYDMIRIEPISIINLSDMPILNEFIEIIGIKPHSGFRFDNSEGMVSWYNIDFIKNKSFGEFINWNTWPWGGEK